MRDLILTGFMGTGKTTVGRLLAQRYCLELVDIDESIERRAGCSITEYWQRHEEPAFRDLEHEVWQDVIAAGEGRVIATGGGTLVHERNRALLGDRVVVCLTCEIEPLQQRLAAEQGVRPVLAGLDMNQVRQDIEKSLARRAPAYELFERIDTTDRTPEDIAGEIAGRFGLSGFEYRFGPEQRTRVEFAGSAAEEVPAALNNYGLAGVVEFVSDRNVMEAVLKHAIFAGLRRRGYPTEEFFWGTVLFPPGEEYKTLDCVQSIYHECRRHLADRSSTIVAVGGGVICDLAGFAAATYMRGIRLALVPTTLLAQADAAIGGKTAVDFAGVKNLIGAFYPAELIIICPEVLGTLSDAQLADGLTEIVKSAAVRCARLLDEVEQLTASRDILARPHIIRRAAELKARVVEADPYERVPDGGRAMLNFGHTVGHGIEAAAEYRLSHGQCISIGMLAESWLSEQLGIAPQGTRDRLATILQRFGQPAAASGLDAEALLHKMRQDKKRLGGAIRMALPTGPGAGAVFEVSEQDARRAVTVALGKEEL